MFIVYALVGGFLLLFLGWLLGRVTQKLGFEAVDGRDGIVDLDELNDTLVLSEAETGQVFQIYVFRQSGNLDRTFTCTSRREAIAHVLTAFRRMKEHSVRIWKTSEAEADLRSPYGNFRGKNEGRKIWGCSVELVSTEYIDE